MYFIIPGTIYDPCFRTSLTSSYILGAAYCRLYRLLFDWLSLVSLLFCIPYIPTMYTPLVLVFHVVVYYWFSSIAFLRSCLDMSCSLLSCWSVNRFSLHARPALPTPVPSSVPVHMRLVASALRRLGIYMQFRLSNGGGNVNRPYVYYGSCTYFLQMPLLYAIQILRLRITRMLILWLAISTVHEQNIHQQNIIFCDALRATTPYKLQSTTAITPTMTVDLKDLKALLFIFKGIATH